MQATAKRLARIGALAALSLVGAASTTAAQDDADTSCDRWPLCESDSDCDAGSRCWVERRTVCPDDLARGCMSGESDDDCARRTNALVEAECEVMERASCNPSWSLPCETDADCGPEFACDLHQCWPADRSCTEDSDCPGDWRCGTYDAGSCEGGDDCVGMQRKVIGCLPPLYCAGVFLLGSDDVDKDEDDAPSHEAESSEPLSTSEGSASASDAAPPSSSGCSLVGTKAPGGGAALLAAWLGLAFARAGRRRVRVARE